MADELKMKLKMNEEVVRQVLEQVLRYCEDQAIYDKLSKYGDFYYKIKILLNQNK